LARRLAWSTRSTYFCSTSPGGGPATDGIINKESSIIPTSVTLSGNISNCWLLNVGFVQELQLTLPRYILENYRYSLDGAKGSTVAHNEAIVGSHKNFLERIYFCCIRSRRGPEIVEVDRVRDISKCSIALWCRSHSRYRKLDRADESSDGIKRDPVVHTLLKDFVVRQGE
jgi:hypothetical protein